MSEQDHDNEDRLIRLAGGGDRDALERLFKITARQKKVSAAVKGFLYYFCSDLEEVEEKLTADGHSYDFIRLLDDDGKRFGEIFVDFVQRRALSDTFSIVDQVFPVEIDLSLSFDQMLEACNMDNINENFNETNFPINQGMGRGRCELLLARVEKKIHPRTISDLLREAGFIIESNNELLTLAMNFPNAQVEFGSIVVLRNLSRRFPPGEHIPELFGDKSSRGITLRGFSKDLEPGTCIIVSKKRLPRIDR